MFFEPVSILFAIVPDYVNDYMTKENINWTSSKSFAPKINLNSNSYTERNVHSLKIWLIKKKKQHYQDSNQDAFNVFLEFHNASCPGLAP